MITSTGQCCSSLVSVKTLKQLQHCSKSLSAKKSEENRRRRLGRCSCRRAARAQTPAPLRGCSAKKLQVRAICCSAAVCAPRPCSLHPLQRGARPGRAAPLMSSFSWVFVSCWVSDCFVDFTWHLNAGWDGEQPRRGRIHHDHDTTLHCLCILTTWPPCSSRGEHLSIENKIIGHWMSDEDTAASIFFSLCL